MCSRFITPYNKTTLTLLVQCFLLHGKCKDYWKLKLSASFITFSMTGTTESQAGVVLVV